MNKALEGAKRLIPPGSRVLCAVSGGADSMCLLALLQENAQELGIEVLAAHYEHGIRGAESQRDCDFVMSFCEQKGIKAVCGHGDVPAFAKANGMGTEQAARELRYAFLEKTADELGCDFIATAHNADDNAETLIFNLTRGSGTAGLAGIPPKRGRIVRPLLETPRSEIEQWLLENRTDHIEDSTNSNLDYSRNKIRAKVMPVLREINPAFSQSAGKLAQLARRDDDCLCALAEAYLADNDVTKEIELESFNALHPAVASRVIRMCAPQTLSSEHVERALTMAREEKTAYADLHGIRICVERGRLYFGRDDDTIIQSRPLVTGGRVEFPEAGIAISCRKGRISDGVNSKFTIYSLKYENIKGELMVKPRREGDKLRPAGRKCTKSVKSLMLERKMTRREKNLCPVIRDEEGILLIPGLVVDARCALSGTENETILSIIIEKL